MTTTRAIALAIALGLSPLSLTPAVALAHHAPTEDSEQWNCIADGNRICGPGNANGVPAGCYDDSAAMVAPWPCHVVVNADGNADIYYGAP